MKMYVYILICYVTKNRSLRNTVHAQSDFAPSSRVLLTIQYRDAEEKTFDSKYFAVKFQAYIL